MPSSPEPGRGRPQQERADASRQDRLGFFFPLLLAYPLFEYCRPEYPLGIPMLLSSLVLVGWLFDANKKWHAQTWCFLALIALMCVGTLLAANTPSALTQTYFMAVTLLGTCVPLIHFATSLRKIRLFINALLWAFVYCALYSITHGGVGPGWQDENYAAALMSMAFPFAYFSIFVAERVLTRMAFAIAAALFVAATVVSFSRGGFLGMAAVLLYCLIRSPKRWPMFLVGPALAIAIAISATPAYWTEMETISDTHEKTAELRLDLWKIAFRMFQANPLTGVGPANFVWNVGDYQSAEQFARYQRSLAATLVAHSLYFELLAELGLAGVIVLGATLYRDAVDLRFVARETTEEHESASPCPGDVRRARYYERAIAGSFIGVLVCGGFVSILYYSYLWILTAMAVSLKEVITRLRERDRTEAEPAGPAARQWWRRTHLQAAEGNSPDQGPWFRSEFMPTRKSDVCRRLALEARPTTGLPTDDREGEGPCRRG
jgi:O-antigen ligase